MRYTGRALELLARAQAASRSDRRDQAAQGHRDAGACFADDGNLLAAAAAYAEGARLAATGGTELLKVILADAQDVVTGRLRAHELAPPERIAAAFQHAARYWSPDGVPFTGHRGLCARCGAWMRLAWSSCERCAAPRTAVDRGKRLLLSERVCHAAILEREARRWGSTELQALLPAAARIFDALLWVGGVARFPEPEHMACGALEAFTNQDRSRAVLCEVVAGHELVEAKPAFRDFVRGVGSALLAGRAWADELEGPRRELQRRFGTSIAVRRTLALEVEHGATGISSTWVVAGHDRSQRRARQQVVCAAAVEADHEHPSPLLLTEFAQDLAHELLMIDVESISPDGRTTDVRALLEGKRFTGDPSLTVSEAAAVLSDRSGAGLTLAGAGRLVRESFDPGDPEAFPGARAMRA